MVDRAAMHSLTVGLSVDPPGWTGLLGLSSGQRTVQGCGTTAEGERLHRAVTAACGVRLGDSQCVLVSIVWPQGDVG